jgi:CAAX protease family protein
MSTPHPVPGYPDPVESFPPPTPAYPHPGPPPVPPEMPEGLARGPRWPAWTAPVALLAGFALALFGAVLIAGVAAAFGARIEDPPPAVLIGGTMFQDAALIITALLFARLYTTPRPWHFGLRPTRLLPAVGWTVLGWFTFFLLSAIWAAALGIDESDELPNELGADESTAALVAVAVLVCVVAPIAEEFFFRGFFFGALRHWKGPWVAAALTGIVFGAIHLGSSPPAFVVPLMAFGFVLCLIYWRTGSLYPCIVLHALNNCLALGISEGWLWWQVIALMVGANAVIATIIVPVGGLRPRADVPASV